MTRALVLSGGGPVGIAWETGIVAALARAGVDLAAADFIVGTSAGSAVGAHLALGTDLEERLRRYEQPPSTPPTTTTSASLASLSAERIGKLIEVMATTDTDSDEGLAAIGAFALQADVPPDGRFVAGFAELADKEWPDGYACTAVDAETGEFVVWDVKAGAPLDRAVASSCSVPGFFAPVTIDGRRYIDGAMRSSTNADSPRVPTPC